MILDIIVILIFILLMIVGYRRGASKTLVSLFVMIAAFLLATFFSQPLATFVYDRFISSRVISSVSAHVRGTESVVLSQTVDALPSFVKSIVGITKFSESDALSVSVENVGNKVSIAVDTALRPLLVSVLTSAFLILLFLVIYILLRFLLTRPLLSLFKLPLIKTLDSVCGLLLSLGTSYLVVSFLAFLLRLLMPATANMQIYLLESTIYNSYIFYHFYSGNIFYNIISLF